MQPSWLEINLAALDHNLKLLRGLSPKAQTIAVIKADAYGHGAAALSKRLRLRGVERFAVATSAEALALRGSGLQEPVLQLGSLHPDDAADAAAARVTPTLVTREAAAAFAAASPGGRVQIKVDSGMGRVGVPPAELAPFVELVEGLGLEVEAVYTHFAVADEDPLYTQKQLEAFLGAAASLPRRYPLHAANSAGVLSGIGADLDFVRLGIALYGLSPDMKSSERLRPILSWKARPTLVKRLAPGHSIGYGRSYITKKEEWIATLPFGYADGFRRSFSNNAYLRWEADYVAVVGRVSMDQTTVRLPRRASLSDVFEVVSADYDERTSLTARARQAGTIHYELATSLGKRLPRRYLEEE